MFNEDKTIRYCSNCGEILLRRKNFVGIPISQNSRKLTETLN